MAELLESAQRQHETLRGLRKSAKELASVAKEVEELSSLTEESVIAALKATIERQSLEMKTQQLQLLEAQDRLREQEGLVASLKAHMAAVTVSQHQQTAQLLAEQLELRQELQREMKAGQERVSLEKTIEGLSQEKGLKRQRRFRLVKELLTFLFKESCDRVTTATDAHSHLEIVQVELAMLAGVMGADPRCRARYKRIHEFCQESILTLKSDLRGQMAGLRGQIEAILKANLDEVLKEVCEKDPVRDNGERPSKRVRTEERRPTPTQEAAMEDKTNRPAQDSLPQLGQASN